SSSSTISFLIGMTSLPREVWTDHTKIWTPSSLVSATSPHAGAMAARATEQQTARPLCLLRDDWQRALDGELPAPLRTCLAKVVAPPIQRQATVGPVLGVPAA